MCFDWVVVVACLMVLLLAWIVVLVGKVRSGAEGDAEGGCAEDAEGGAGGVVRMTGVFVPICAAQLCGLSVFLFVLWLWLL